MKTAYPILWPQFYTATIYQWKHLFLPDTNKDIIINSLYFLVNEKRITLNAFVIMSNHIHLIWQALAGNEYDGIKNSFMKCTAQRLKHTLEIESPDALAQFKVNKYDREYQLWKRRPLSVELFTPEVFDQKLNYIHYNPVRAGLCKYPEEYHYSSAKFYQTGVDDFGLLSHYSEN